MLTKIGSVVFLAAMVGVIAIKSVAAVGERVVRAF